MSRALRSTSATDRRRAAAEAGHTGDQALARSLLDDDVAAVRATALGALCRMGAATVPDLERGLRDPSPEVRRRAVILAVPFATPPLTPLVGDPDPAVAEQAAFALGERNPTEPGSAAALAVLATDHPDPLVREAAVAALGSLGDPVGLPAVLAATSDKPAVRRRAVLALAAFDGPQVDEALNRALADRDWQTRQSAETVLGAGR